MGLKETFQKAALAGVNAFGNVRASTIYVQVSSASTYSASTGVQAVAESSTAGVMVIFDVFKFREIDNINVRADDKKALVPALSIPGIVPTPEDRIIESSAVWNVVAVEVDPAGALYTLQVRRS